MPGRSLLAGPLALLLAACTVFSPEGPVAATVEQDGIQYHLEIASSSYKPGETAHLTYQITNTTDKVFLPGRVANCEYCTAQFHATQDGREVWRTCRVIPPCGEVEFSMAPGETREWVQEWALANDNGTMETEDDSALGRGTYAVVAELYLAATVRRVPVSITFTIR